MSGAPGGAPVGGRGGEGGRAGGERPPEGRPARILVVEDEAIVAADVEQQLLQLGYQVVGWARSGEEAVEVALRERPDLVVMDVRLKGAMDGVDAARRIQERHAAAFLFVTAHSDASILSRAEALGLRRFGRLLKPFRDDGMREAVEVALAGRPSA